MLKAKKRTENADNSNDHQIQPSITSLKIVKIKSSKQSENDG